METEPDPIKSETAKEEIMLTEKSRGQESVIHLQTDLYTDEDRKS